ncbi:hypothetical protein ACFQLX_11750 [Streptomyces polyrhachis]|uniref:Secreted protein n=1 Tax=Streptomyces polyrhachis TaxID=1282885 RepID=A0ABW2GH15_9ACTN
MSALTRTAAAGTAAIALLGASISPAAALEAGEDYATLSNKTISIVEGSMTFIDDGDVFQICDNLADGKGVYGALWYNSYIYTDGYQRVMTLSDGGDSGCDKTPHNIGNGGSYVMTICWGRYPTNPFESTVTGNGPCTHSGEFNE